MKDFRKQYKDGKNEEGKYGGFLTETKTQTLSSQEMYAMAKSELERLSDI